jgi:prevent-host-death family protein
MNETINLAEARKRLPELTDRANAGQAYLLSRRGREIAALIGIEEYRHLKALERVQHQQDFDVLLAPPEPGALTEDEARQMAIEIVRQVRIERHASEKK